MVRGILNGLATRRITNMVQGRVLASTLKIVLGMINQEHVSCTTYEKFMQRCVRKSKSCLKTS